MEVFAAFAASLGLMVSYYLMRRLWRQLRYVKPRDRGIDPVGEAEVFLAYGKVSEAVRVLKVTVREEPDNLPAKITLLRAYSHSGDSKAYSLLARDVESRLQGQPVWKTIQQHGRELDPTNPLFNR
ncbi:type IV pilus assembly protein FimV [Gulbenkiania mobilis]|uniref:type IV pilus assembly protein FimV n=1 Tax=Gulbenkiania mobilis TaxID=397457 RepID=UPI000AEE66CD|nr:pilus assembly protein FimV [Gulbenkiania mobilis]